MATKNTATVEQPVAQSSEGQPSYSLEHLVAQRKQLGEQIKAARAALPKQTPLEKEVARQQQAGIKNGFVGPFYAKLVAKRVALGVSQDDAVEQVAALWRQWTLAALANLTPSETK